MDSRDSQYSNRVHSPLMSFMYCLDIFMSPLSIRENGITALQLASVKDTLTVAGSHMHTISILHFKASRVSLYFSPSFFGSALLPVLCMMKRRSDRITSVIFID